MKYTTLRAFEKHLEEAAPLHFSSLYMILTKESFLRRSIGEKITAFLNADGKVLLKSFSADQPIESFLSELVTYNLFSKKQAFFLHNVEKFSKPDLEKLALHFRKMNPSTYLILLGSDLNGTTYFYKQAEKAGVILDLPEEKPWEKEKTVSNWLLETSLKNGKKMAHQTALSLVKQLGVDLALLSTELEKLICYVGDRAEISPEDISAISGIKNGDTIWQLSEALFKKDTSKALAVAKSMQEEGTALIGLLRQIRSQYQTELQISYILAQGGSSNDVVAQFPYMRGAILENHLNNARSWGVKKLKTGLLHIDNFELKAKNSSIDPEILTELLIVQLTTT